MSYKKNLIPKGWYHATIRDAREHEGFLRLTWTIDRGKYVYRNIIEKFRLNDEGLAQLKIKMDELDYVIYENYEDDFFFEQFTTTEFRSLLHLDRAVVSDNIKNVILERKFPEKPKDYNVKKRKDERFYNQNNKGRSLPIKERSKKTSE